MALLLAAYALAARVTLPELERDLPQLMRDVAGEVGRDFADPPTLDIDDSNGVRARLDPDSGLDPQQTLAVYLGREHAVVIVSNVTAEMIAATDADDELLRPFLHCNIYHELVHALQAQYGHLPTPETEAEKAMFRAMSEGQAVLVERRLCDPRTAGGFASVATGTDALSSRDPGSTQAFDYGFAGRYMQQLHAAGGWEATWSALEAPPTREELLAAVAPTLATGWRDTGPLRAALARLGAGERISEEGVFSPVSLLSNLMGSGFDPKFALGAEGSLCARGRDSGEGMACAMLVTQPAAATRWLAARRAAVVRGRTVYSPLSLGAVSSLRVQEAPRVEKAGLSTPHVVRAGLDRGTYLDAWALHGNVLAGIAVRGERLSPRDLQDALVALASAYPQQIPPLVPLPSNRPAADPGISADFVGLRLQTLVARDRAAAIDHGLRLCPLVATSERDLAFEMVHWQALEAGGTELADRVVAVAGWTPATGTASEHVERLFNAGRFRDARQLLDRLRPSTDDERAWYRSASKSVDAALRAR